jgi:hypothetical protein
MPRIALHAVSRSTLALAVTASVAACSYSGETVFTRQNQAASALATMGMEAEAKNSVNLDRIYAVETQLHEACAPLRDIASRRMIGEEVGIDSELEALVSLDRCAMETTRVESFIWRDDPVLARIFLSPKSAEPKGVQEALK